MHGNGRPLGMRKRMQMLVAVVLLAWATQTLLHQWGFGAEVPAEQQQGQSGQGAERFVPGTARFAAGATLELRGDATVIGAEVRLKQICRWSKSDSAVFAPVADLVICRLTSRAPFRAITVDEIRSTLHDAGVNLGVVKFAGPLSCTVGRSDAAYDERSALRAWAQAKEDSGSGDKADATGKDDPQAPGPSDVATEDSITASSSQSPTAKGDTKIAPVPVFHPAVRSSPATEPAEASAVKSLRSLLVNDLSTRLGLSLDQLQVTFNPKDEKLLNLSEPLFQFNIESRQVRDLGDVSWNVTVVTGGGSQKGVITAQARAWQNQVVVARPLSYHQVVRPADVTERRMLVDRMPYEPLLTTSQIVGQEAARDLKAGTVISNRMVDPVPLVKPGQLVTVSLDVGSVRVKTVGRAMESGAYGQTVKVRNETTRDVYEVIMTGPQEGTMGPLSASAKMASISQ